MFNYGLSKFELTGRLKFLEFDPKMTICWPQEGSQRH